jgi:hypothetical protein
VCPDRVRELSQVPAHGGDRRRVTSTRGHYPLSISTDINNATPLYMQFQINAASVAVVLAAVFMGRRGPVSSPLRGAALLLDFGGMGCSVRQP